MRVSSFLPYGYIACCVTCILRWASYHEHPRCPQCKNSFEFLIVHPSIDGIIQDFMFAESVCLLLRAPWFRSLKVSHENKQYDEFEDVYRYIEANEGLEESYYNNSLSIRIGNRRWSDSGFAQSGRREVRPIHRSNSQNLRDGSSSEPNKKEVGRRAKRALKREVIVKVAAPKVSTASEYDGNEIKF